MMAEELIICTKIHHLLPQQSKLLTPTAIWIAEVKGDYVRVIALSVAIGCVIFGDFVFQG
jgi:hypothetical protein